MPNYAFLKTYTPEQLKSFHSYISENVRRARSKRIGWCRAMLPLWVMGMLEAERLLKINKLTEVIKIRPKA